MSGRGVQDGDEQPSIARRVEELTQYCSGKLSLEGLQERIEGIPPAAVRGSIFFLRACINEEVTFEMIECLLDAFPGAAQSADDEDWSPLHYACMNNNPDPGIVRLLLNSWPESASLRDSYGNLPLHALCDNPEDNETSSLATLDLLLAAAPHSATIVNSDGCLPIHIAIQYKPHSFCKRLIDVNPESLRVQIDNGNGCLPIHLACWRSNVETVKCLLELYPESIDARTSGGDLPIHNAAARFGGEHKADIIRYLLAKDPDYASRTGNDESLPLHFASLRKCLDSARLLFDAYPEAINIRDGDGRTPLDRALRGHEIAEFLEDQLAYARRADDTTALATPDENGWLPLHLALRDGASLGAIKLLITGNQSALQVVGNNLVFPLHIACECSSVGVVQHLLGLLDIHLHTLDMQKNSTLHYACRGGNLGVIKCLLERHVPSVSEPNSDGKLPIHLLWDSDRIDRDSVEYVEAVWHLLLAHPETVMLDRRIRMEH